MPPSLFLLVVDDDPALGAIARALGRRAGWRVEHHTSAEAAWEELQVALPDLVLLDVNLPGASGPDLCRRLRADHRLSGLRVALFTHLGLGADVAAGLDAGADALVSKELVGQPEAWQERIAEVLALPDSRASAGAVGWTAAGACPDDWAGRLQRALRQPALRALGPEVWQALFRRAAARSSVVPAESAFSDVESWAERLPPHVAPAQFVAALADELRRLLGAAADAPAQQLLIAVMPEGGPTS